MKIIIKLNEDIKKRLNHLAKETGESKTFLLNTIIEQGIEDVEDYYSAMEVLRRIRNGEERVYSSEEVHQHLGLDDI